jgi:hypothetical protein
MCNGIILGSNDPERITRCSQMSNLRQGQLKNDLDCPWGALVVCEVGEGRPTRDQLKIAPSHEIASLGNQLIVL